MELEPFVPVHELGYAFNVTDLPPINFTFHPRNRTGTDWCPIGEQRGYDSLDVGNYTCPFMLEEFPAWELGLKISFYVVAIFLAVVGNLCVLLVVILNKRMHSRTYFYLCNLAVSDLMIGVFNMWIHLGMNINGDWPFAPLLCKLFPFFQIIALTASTGCLSLIAGERLFATVYPMKAKFSRLYKHALVASVVWIIAVGVALPMLFVREMSSMKWADRDQKWCAEKWPRYVVGASDNVDFFCEYDYPERRAYYTIQVVVMYLLPIVFTSAAYSVIGYTFFKRRAPGNQTDQVIVQQQRAKRKVIKMLVIVFASFVICWTPQEVIVLMETYESNLQIPESLRYVAIYIAYFNSALNPILYAGLNDKFIRGFKELLKCNIFTSMKVAPATTDSLRASGATGAGSTPSVQSQQHKKQLTLLQQGQPRLPPIHEDQSEVWGQRVNNSSEECDKASATRDDITDGERESLRSSVSIVGTNDLKSMAADSPIEFTLGADDSSTTNAM